MKKIARPMKILQKSLKMLRCPLSMKNIEKIPAQTMVKVLATMKNGMSMTLTYVIQV